MPLAWIVLAVTARSATYDEIRAMNDWAQDTAAELESNGGAEADDADLLAPPGDDS